MKGLFNRLAEANLPSIVSSIEEVNGLPNCHSKRLFLSG